VQELRDRVRKLLDETGIKQVDIVREINGQGLYRADTAELCNAIKGKLTSPKANRMVADAYSILTREQAKQIRQKLRKL